MTGPSHRLIAFAGAVLWGASPLEGVAVALGATLPDSVERVGLKHRGISHWPLPWVLLVLALWDLGSPLGVWLGWFVAGALFHIAADLFTMGGVPLFLPPWRVRLGLMRTGGMGEYVVAATVVSIAVLKVFGVPFLGSWP